MTPNTQSLEGASRPILVASLPPAFGPPDIYTWHEIGMSYIVANRDIEARNELTEGAVSKALPMNKGKICSTSRQ
jgi:hypothetical protein